MGLAFFDWVLMSPVVDPKRPLGACVSVRSPGQVNRNAVNVGSAECWAPGCPIPTGIRVCGGQRRTEGCWDRGQRLVQPVDVIREPQGGVFFLNAPTGQPLTLGWRGRPPDKGGGAVPRPGEGGVTKRSLAAHRGRCRTKAGAGGRIYCRFDGGGRGERIPPLRSTRCYSLLE